MSAFLGPIHYWLYNKIELQEKLVEAILTLNNKQHYVENLQQNMDSRCGYIEKKPLEEMIDESNIHGWLQDKVSIVERRLSYAVTVITDSNPVAMSKIFDTVKEFGVHVYKSNPESFESAEQVYRKLNDMLLDGMPCDHVNELVSVSSDEVIYRRRMCIHEDYWTEQNGMVNKYYDIRCQFIEGFLSETKFAFKADNQGNYHIAYK